MAHITVAQAKANRLDRRAKRRAQVAERAAARRAYRTDLHTVASHLYAMGVDTPTAIGMASTLRKRITTPGVPGYAARSLTDSRRRPCTRYTRRQVMDGLRAYKPRKFEYQEVRAALLGLAA
ncbi:hypothetical protein ACOQFV_24405 [Nocardiopsis changdeensis]|uniref:Integrase n=1 Tax=Nocardiopsis changdeensis TaxID=2831969 RepID=A0A975KTW8_9ACTN|nr:MULTISPECIES: hypothetical protein [Nocardiopsis]QUX26467.1 hypothetical protein KGD84_32735 [Nocardiopsis changdeensis]QYX40739.1 hypothetical protein K1J57_32585 [Nocardiopsis sp. MT53]